MLDDKLLLNTPLEEINCSFTDYVNRKKRMLSSHMSGNGLPDYAYCMDYEYRKKLDSIPGLFKNLRRLLIPEIQKQYQLYNMQGLKVSPSQYSEIYQMGCDCAKILGIGIPTIVILPAEEINAFSVCVDDQEPLICIYSLMLKRFTPGEIKAVIAHECGHAHNNHVIYSLAAELLISAGINGFGMMIPGVINQLAGFLSTGVKALLSMWSRAAEVTADRAAMLCCDSLDDVYNVEKKLLTHGQIDIGDNTNTQIDLDELKKQMDIADDSPYRVYEALNFDHPMSIRRIFAEMEFAKCETLYSWRPDLRQPGLKLNSREATDEACKKIIGVLQTKESRKND